MTSIINSDYPIDRLTAVLDNAHGTALPAPNGFYSCLNIPDDMLTDNDRAILCEFMRAEIKPGSGLVIVLKGNDQTNIVFDSESDAISSASQQICNLSKQLMFSIYRKTRIKFSIGEDIFKTKV